MFLGSLLGNIDFAKLDQILREPKMNERITEDIVRSHFKNDSMFKSIKLEEQKTTNSRIKKLLNNASKKRTNKSGFPEFIITFPSLMDLVIIIECKSRLEHHKNRSGVADPEKYAVDGVLHYSKFLNDEFDVIAIAVSGQKNDELLVTNYAIEKKNIVKEIDQKLLSIYDYISIMTNKNNAEKLKHENILLTASKLNKKLYDYTVPESERATIISGILIALQNDAFKDGYDKQLIPSELVEDLLTAIERVLKKNKMQSKISTLMTEYNTIRKSNKLSKEKQIRNSQTGQDEPNTILRDLIHEIKYQIFPFTTYDDAGYDILGQFYSEFIRYANGDRKLGLVLTPSHIAELFIDIVDLNKDDILYDNCCGTAGFLIKGMKELFSLAGNDSTKKEEIKNNQLFGFEPRPDMFTYACSNMMMRGDGKSNIYQGDCLVEKNKKKMKNNKPTVGLLNPPYATNIPELEFVYSNLECLVNNGRCVAIVPFSSVLDDSGSNYQWKKKLLEKHTLEAVFSVPTDVFYPIGVVTAIVVFKAHNPHPKNYETYFGYWRNDGFIKKKHLGRIDSGNWDVIKKDWLYNFKNKKEIAYHSIMKEINADDEWCAEAYLETNYGDLKEDDFIQTMKEYALFNIVNSGS